MFNDEGDCLSKTNTEAEVFNEVVSILSDVSDLKPKIPVKSIDENTSWRNEIGFDSLAMMILFVEVQTRYPSLDPAVIVKWKTVKDCVQSIADVK